MPEYYGKNFCDDPRQNSEYCTAVATMAVVAAAMHFLVEEVGDLTSEG